MIYPISKLKTYHLAHFVLGLGLATVSMIAATNAYAMGGKPKPPVEDPLLPGEPAYCAFRNLMSTEVNVRMNGLDRIHSFALGQVRLTGLAVGNSDNRSIKAFDTSLDRTIDRTSRYCTWYLNDGDNEAEQDFNWHYVPSPGGRDYEDMSNRYMTILGYQFSRDRTNFVSCAERSHFITLGCNGMKHRGPTVFAMILAYSGCSPKKAVGIVNGIWGENGIKPEMRMAIAQKAYELGRQETQASARLRELFGGK